MKKSLITLPLLLALAATPLMVQKEYKISFAGTSYRIETQGTPTLVTNLPTTIDLNPVNASEIRDYYSPIASLSESERQGTNLLKNLKNILKDMNYFKYGGMSSPGVTYIYAITDRDWEHSPASAITAGTYDATTNTITDFNYKNDINQDPYVKMLYVDYTKQETTHFKLASDPTKPNFDKEHVWCQSRGFKGKTDTADGPAGTDLHHLIAGDSYVNQQPHNNNPYGFVKDISVRGDKEYTKDNFKGSAKHTSSQDEATVVFEPQDCDKGDIARALFYMAARYNNWAGLTGVITDFEPFLALSNYATSSGNAVYSTDTTPVTMGILSDLLAWNKLDPVDDYEIRRNDLIYRNYQGNRNPFIDFPQWADCIWGTANMDGTGYNSTVTKSANPNVDRLNDSGLNVSHKVINLAPGASQKVSATTVDSSGITWTVSDDSVVELEKNSSASGEEINLKALKVGKVTVKATATIEGQETSRNITVTITETPKPNYILYIAIGAGALVVIIIVAIIYAKGSKKTKKKIASTVKKGVKSYTKSSSSSSKKSSSKKKK